MERNEFIKKMLVLGSELANTDDKLQISMIVNDAELLTKKYESELKKLRVTDVNSSLPVSEIVDCGKDGRFEVCNICGNAKRQ